MFVSVPFKGVRGIIARFAKQIVAAPTLAASVVVRAYFDRKWLSL